MTDARPSPDNRECKALHDPGRNRIHMARFRSSHDIPAGPPPEVLAEIDAAWERATGLTADGFDVQFLADPDTGRLCAELRIESVLLERLSAHEALAFACGDTLVPAAA